jgi:hypothetical protein
MLHVGQMRAEKMALPRIYKRVSYIPLKGLLWRFSRVQLKLHNTFIIYACSRQMKDI